MRLARPPCKGASPAPCFVSGEQSPRWRPLPWGPTGCCFSPSGHRLIPGFMVVMGEQPVKDQRHPGGLGGKQVKQRTHKFKCGSLPLCCLPSFTPCASSTSSCWLAVEVNLHDNRGDGQASSQSDERLPARPEKALTQHRVSGRRWEHCRT